MKVNVVGKVSNYIERVVKDAVYKVVHFLKQPHNLEFTIKMVDENEIRDLNRRMRNIDKSTDVLSFPNINVQAGEIISQSEMAENCYNGADIYIGDCALCLTIAQKQADEFGHSLESEVRKLVVHSVLHVLGYDHIKDEDYAVMHNIEKLILGDDDE